jgi:hypothetical protein
MSTGYPLTYVVPGDELRSREQAMADNFARHGGDPSRVTFRQAAAWVRRTFRTDCRRPDCPPLTKTAQKEFVPLVQDDPHTPCPNS